MFLFHVSSTFGQLDYIPNPYRTACVWTPRTKTISWHFLILQKRFFFYVVFFWAVQVGFAPQHTTNMADHDGRCQWRSQHICMHGRNHTAHLDCLFIFPFFLRSSIMAPFIFWQLNPSRYDIMPFPHFHVECPSQKSSSSSSSSSSILPTSYVEFRFFCENSKRPTCPWNLRLSGRWNQGRPPQWGDHATSWGTDEWTSGRNRKTAFVADKKNVCT